VKIYKDATNSIIVEETDYKIIIFEGATAMDPNNDNVDVNVLFNSGERYVATFFTLTNVEYLINSWIETKEHNAKYFWSSDAIVVEKLDTETIREVVKNLIALNDLSSAFSGPFTD
jgi:hypothetical protein